MSDRADLKETSSTQPIHIPADEMVRLMSDNYYKRTVDPQAVTRQLREWDKNNVSFDEYKLKLDLIKCFPELQAKYVKEHLSEITECGPAPAPQPTSARDILDPHTSARAILDHTDTADESYSAVSDRIYPPARNSSVLSAQIAVEHQISDPITYESVKNYIAKNKANMGPVETAVANSVLAMPTKDLLRDPDLFLSQRKTEIKNSPAYVGITADDNEQHRKEWSDISSTPIERLNAATGGVVTRDTISKLQFNEQVDAGNIVSDTHKSGTYVDYKLLLKDIATRNDDLIKDKNKTNEDEFKPLLAQRTKNVAATRSDFEAAQLDVVGAQKVYNDAQALAASRRVSRHHTEHHHSAPPAHEENKVAAAKKDLADANKEYILQKQLCDVFKTQLAEHNYQSVRPASYKADGELLKTHIATATSFMNDAQADIDKAQKAVKDAEKSATSKPAHSQQKEHHSSPEPVHADGSVSAAKVDLDHAKQRVIDTKAAWDKAKQELSAQDYTRRRPDWLQEEIWARLRIEFIWPELSKKTGTVSKEQVKNMAP